MKKIIKWILLITLLLFVSYWFLKTLTYMMKPSGYNLNNIAGFYSEKRNSLDMVYIGGSAAFVYWEPLEGFHESGIASYSYAADSVQPEIYKTLIKEIFKYQDPELIVIDARPFQYREKEKPPSELSYRSFLTGMPFSFNKLEFIVNNVSQTLDEDVSSYIFDIIKYHRVVEKVPDENYEMMLNKYVNKYKGFYFVPKTEKMKTPDNLTDEVTPIVDETNDILMELIEYLNTTDCEYLFVVSPYIQTKSQKAQLNYIEKVVTENGYDFLDANEYYGTMNIDFDKDLYNDDHVNIFGADKYTDFMIEYLDKNYDLEDRRKDDDYKDWHTYYEEWLIDSNENKTIINNIIKERE